MKKLLLVLLLVIASFSSQGQVVIFESFDNTTFAPGNWQNQNVSGPWFWERAISGSSPSCTPHSGDGMATFAASNYIEGRQAALITPAVDLSATTGKTVEVNFWMYRDDIYSAAYDSVVVSVGTTNVIANSTRLGKINRFLGFSPVEGTSGWYNYSFTIPITFNGASNYIFFKACGDGGGNIYVDDISLKILPLPANDAGVISIFGTKGVAPIGTLPIKASIYNFGSSNLTSATINWSVNGVNQTPVSYTTPSLSSGTSSALVTLGSYNFSTPGTYAIQVWTTLPNGVADGYSQNDLKTTTIEVREFASLPYTQNFDGTWINGASTRDKADKYIINTPSTGNSSLRREDDGASASWTTTATGSFAISGANGTLHSARYHSTEAINDGQLDFHVDLSTVGDKKLSFSSYQTAASYTSVYLSVDSGATFTYIAGIDPSSSQWQRYEYSLGNSVSHAAIVRFTFPAQQQCDLGIDQLYIGLKAVNDGGISAVIEPAVGYATGVSNAIKVKVKNYGSDDLNSATINWSIDGINQTPFSYVNSYGLSQNSVDEIEIGSFNFPTAKKYDLKVWASNPNGSTDGDNGNDMTEVSVYVNSVVTLPYSETFEADWINQGSTRDGVTSSWKNEVVSGNDSWRRDDDGVAADWSSSEWGAYSPTGANSSAHSARFHSYISSSNSSLFLNLNMSPLGNKILSFWYINADGYDNLTIGISTDGGNTFTDLKTVDVATDWTKYQVSLGTSTTQRAIIRFLADGDYGSTDIGLDDLAIQVSGNDAGVSAITSPDMSFATSVRDITVKVKNFGTANLTSAQIGWSVNGVAQTPKSFANAGLTTATESTSFNLGTYNFASAGSYEIKAWTVLPNGTIDEDMGNDTTSINVNALGAHNIPYNENFDGVTEPAIPLGMSVSDNNTDDITWETSPSYSYSSPNAMNIYYNQSLAMNDWFFTPPLNLVAGKEYDLSFWYRCSGSYTEKLEVKFGSSASAAGMTGGTVYNNSVIESSIYLNATCVITPATTGVYYVGFHGYSDKDMWYLAVDDISITDPSATPIEVIGAENGQTISLYPSPVNEVLNLSSQVDFEKITIVNTLGQVVWSGDSYAFPLNTSEFVSGVYTIIFDTKDGNRVSLKFVKQ